MIRIAVCEDNSIHRTKLIGMITKAFEHELNTLCEITTFETAAELREELENISFQIVVLDIFMGDSTMDGLALGKLINEHQPHCQIIYITAYAQYISAVYEIEHTYFILKTELNRYLLSALKKAVAKCEELQNDSFCFQWGHNTFCLPLHNIIYLERKDRTTIIYTAQKQYYTREKLKDLICRLPQPTFIRCHHSFVVHCRYVHEFQRTAFLCQNDIHIPISRKYHDQAEELFHQYLQECL